MVANYKLFHLRNLIILAKADGVSLDVENEFIRSVMVRENLTYEDYEYCLTNKDNVEYEIPEDYNERMEYLYDLIKLMVIDGKIDEQELKVCEDCARMMKIPNVSIRNVVINIIPLIQKDIELSQNLL